MEQMAQSAIMAPVSYFDAATQKRPQIEELRKAGKQIPDQLRRLEFDTESFCNDMDAAITIQGGLVNRIQYRRAENVLGGIHHTIRPESTIEGLSKKDEMGRRDKTYLFGRSRTRRWAEQEKKRRLSRSFKAKHKPKRNERSTYQRSFDEPKQQKHFGGASKGNRGGSRQFKGRGNFKHKGNYKGTSTSTRYRKRSANKSSSSE